MLVWSSLGQFRGTYTITASQISTTAATNSISSYKEVSTWSWDLSSNNWDVSWWWDGDWPSTTLSLWESDANNYCNSQIYDKLRPLTKWIDRSYLTFYNKRMGITIDDNKSKSDIWITKDDRPSYGTYYNLIDLSTTSDQNTILDRWFEWIDYSIYTDTLTYNGKLLYNYGDAIQIYDSTRGIRLNFMIPLTNQNGGWDFSSSVIYGLDNYVSCPYQIQSLTECSSILSAATYAGYKVASYRSGTDIASITIATGSTSPATSGSSTDWSNHLTNLQLVFKYKVPSGYSGFYIDSVEMSYSTSTNTLAVGDIESLTVLTKFVQSGSTITYRSGNPGYVASKRLLLATLSSGTISLSGFRKDISDDTNSWLTSGTGLPSITFNYVKFNEDINLQCYKAIASAAALQTEWTSTAYQSYYMFKQFTKFGRYGNAQTTQSSDWYDITTQSVSTAPSYDSATTTCKNMITTIQYQVMISEIGYKDNMQKYIVAINAKPLQEDVKFTGSSINVSYRVIFTNYVVLPSAIRTGDTIDPKFPPKISNDIGLQLPKEQSKYVDDVVMENQ